MGGRRHLGCGRGVRLILSARSPELLSTGVDCSSAYLRVSNDLPRLRARGSTDGSWSVKMMRGMRLLLWQDPVVWSGLDTGAPRSIPDPWFHSEQKSGDEGFSGPGWRARLGDDDKVCGQPGREPRCARNGSAFSTGSRRTDLVRKGCPFWGPRWTGPGFSTVRVCLIQGWGGSSRRWTRYARIDPKYWPRSGRHTCPDLRSGLICLIRLVSSSLLSPSLALPYFEGQHEPCKIWGTRGGNK